MYELSISRDFIAQHYLIGGDWGAENDRHSHHYRVEVVVEHDQLDKHGYLIDIVELENVLSEILSQYRERTLNDCPAFTSLNPSLEHFARILHQALKSRLNFREHRLKVKLWENERDWAAFRD